MANPKPLPLKNGDEEKIVTVRRLALEAQLDVRTVQRAMKNGIDKMRAAVDRERLKKAAKKLGVELKSPSTTNEGKK